MNKEIEVYLKELAIEKLMQSEWGDKLKVAMSTFEKVQEYFYALSEKRGEEKVTLIKSVTVMTFLVLKKAKNGKDIKTFTSDDWKEIAEVTSEYAIRVENQRYVTFVFWMYEQYIRESANYIESFATERVVCSIRCLADELQQKAELLSECKISESEYIESCLWISLEAMIKLIASWTARIAPEEFEELAQALAIYAFEYGRFVLYKKEKAIINGYIEEQYIMTSELDQKYTAFLKELEDEANKFLVLVDNAFAPDFRERFLYSISLAKEVGVDENELLMDLEAIDSFFLE